MDGDTGHRQRLHRRQALRLLGGGALAAALAACAAPRSLVRTTVAAPSPTAEPSTSDRGSLATPAPAAPRRAVRPVGSEQRTLLADSEWATTLSVRHSGLPGRHVMVLGGVHGNEPGGWLAAEEIAAWTPRAGSLLVVPRANVVATHALARTLPELGDLNRLYPGSAGAVLPMARMAAAIVDVAREFEVELLLDLHESWGFFVGRPQDGTAFLGQTVSKGVGPIEMADLRHVVDAVNDGLPQREQLVFRDRSSWRRRPPVGGEAESPEIAAAIADLWLTQDATVTARSSSSLALGGYVPGLTPVLVEMGQEGQPEARRVDLHLLLVRSMLERQGML